MDSVQVRSRGIRGIEDLSSNNRPKRMLHKNSNLDVYMLDDNDGDIANADDAEYFPDSVRNGEENL